MDKYLFLVNVLHPSTLHKYKCYGICDKYCGINKIAFSNVWRVKIVIRKNKTCEIKINYENHGDKMLSLSKKGLLCDIVYPCLPERHIYLLNNLHFVNLDEKNNKFDTND